MKLINYYFYKIKNEMNAYKKLLFLFLVFICCFAVLFFTILNSNKSYISQKNQQNKNLNSQTVEDSSPGTTTEMPLSINNLNGNSNTASKNNSNKRSSAVTENTNIDNRGSNNGEESGEENNNEPVNESISATVAFYSDSQTDTAEEEENHQRVVNNILATAANPIFHAGDLMEDGTEASWNYFLEATATLRSTRTFYAALGNNDRKVGDSSTPSPFWINFAFPNSGRWYSINDVIYI